jgi:iron complex outermembrane receptor protein
MKDRYSYKNGQAIPNPTIKPEHARNWTLGYSHVFPHQTMMQVELFHNDMYDSIQKVIIPAEFSGQCPTLNNPLICEQSVNIAEERRQGVEFTVRSSGISHLTLDANYSFLRRTLAGTSYMEGSPRHRFITSAGLQMFHRILVMAVARYESGATYNNESGFNFLIPAFATADLSGVVPVYSGVTLRLGVKNLFDRNYYFQEGFPEAGRNWYFNLLYRF